MLPYTKPEDLKRAIAIAAKELGCTEEQFMVDVYWAQRRKYDREDVEAWMTENDIAWEDEDQLERIVDALEDDYDSDLSVWDNIDRAVDYVLYF